ncbi:phosphodiesterase/alkaline phosphatase D [Gorgonomyces haynaldii]|nr:phosphodiesterase/alkaline phosphatase D [Gorgonomyces haynaldii]
MGIPKFFRWISERYPLCSEMVQENRIPEFDHLYLDMNGIIHNCSHPKDEDASFRITEAQIFVSIFNYIDHLFNQIKPRKVFLMAIDGVAPRAKMNQQRSRRFRSAMDARQQREKAIRSGMELPDEPAGTPFMDRLHQQLKYFVVKKVSEDPNWKDIQVILSGHDVPGEGEHKIMEFIRTWKSSPDYTPSTRHCMYGLDADLMMLGLVTHEPHFSLLREEVTFGKKSKKIVKVEDTRFFLLHLSLFREYLDLEFSTIRESLDFEYDFERIVDDFILMSFFVGNDFLPHLPGLDIVDGALAKMFDIYKELLPSFGGYINNNGQMDLNRCELFLNRLGDIELEKFKESLGDVAWLRAKRPEAPVQSSKLQLSKEQKQMYEQVKQFVLGSRDVVSLTMDWGSTPAKDRKFILTLVGQLGLEHMIEYGTPNEKATAKIVIEYGEEDDESDEESLDARRRVLKKYDQAPVLDQEEIFNDYEQQQKKALVDEFESYKRSYYKIETKQQVQSLAFSYIQGLQWVLQYYYLGVPSWAWYFPSHYALRVSDIKNISDYTISFELGKPFRPFDQLMAVLPPDSGDHVPECFRSLMTDPSSPIIDFYPRTFETDLNGKKADWEAVVKIPFIDQDRLLKAIEPRLKLLSRDEVKRNTLGNPLLFHFVNVDRPVTYPSSLPNHFPDITHCQCKMDVFKLYDGKPLPINVIREKSSTLRPGFPTLKTLHFSASLGYHGVQIFQRESKAESVVVMIKNEHEMRTLHDICGDYQSKQVFIGWPYLLEASLVAIMDETVSANFEDGVPIMEHQTEEQAREVMKKKESLEALYSKRGILTGPIEFIVKAKPLKGMQLNLDGSMHKEFAKEPISFPLQLLVDGETHEDPRFKNRKPIPTSVDLPSGSLAFIVSDAVYGLICKIQGHPSTQAVDIKAKRQTDPTLRGEPSFPELIAQEQARETIYYPSFALSRQLGISALGLSKLTSSFFVEVGNQRVNLGLCLKYESKSQKVLGLSRKSENGWEFTTKVVDLLQTYKRKFPTVFDALNKRSQADYYTIEELFGNDYKPKLLELQQWLKDAGIKSLITVPLSAEALTGESIGKLETMLGEYLEEKAKDPIEIISITNVPRKPAHCRYRLLDQKFALGHRVKMVSDEGPNLGALGTVVGIEGDVLDILFDEKDMAYDNLGGRCSPNRGLSVPKHYCLNLSHIQPPIPVDAPKKEVPRQRSKPQQTNRNQWASQPRETPRENQKGKQPQQRQSQQNLNQQRQQSQQNLNQQRQKQQSQGQKQQGQKQVQQQSQGQRQQQQIQGQRQQQSQGQKQGQQQKKGRGGRKQDAQSARDPVDQDDNVSSEQATQMLKNMLHIGTQDNNEQLSHQLMAMLRGEKPE